MKITRQMLSIPPYLSTPWENVAALNSHHVGSTFTLIVTLDNRSQVEVPGLDQTSITTIFEAHAQFLENQRKPQAPEFPGPISFSLPLKPDGEITSLGESMQHNPAQANLPNLPPDVLEKITNIARAFGLEDTSALSPPIENCNCMYCQIMRAFDPAEAIAEEPVSTEDLQFRDWEVQQQDDKLYTVTNPLDKNEHYNVFLGTPLGCTCGHKSCEHIKAVLSS